MQVLVAYENEIQGALSDLIMISLHLKATMIKVSDPILFRHSLHCCLFQGSVGKACNYRGWCQT